MNWQERANRFLDALPRTVLSRFGRPVPMFRTCGIAGFYVALLVLFAGGLVTSRSLPVLALLAAVSGLSFFAYTYLRRWITGREELVLLEHVWFALACNAAFLWLLGLPVLAYLDVVSVALCPFLAAGRIGCTFVGCCHGRPSTIGVTYTNACASEGFPAHLVGVRLFPVQPIEALGLLAIGVTGALALPFAEPGRVFSWYLIAYAVIRFGLEGLRGDHRPHWLGLSQARWMSIVEVTLALSLDWFSAPAAGVAGGFFVAFVLALAFLWRRDPNRLLLERTHTLELRNQIGIAIERAMMAADSGPIRCATSRRVTAVVSLVGRYQPAAAHISLSVDRMDIDLLTLCQLAARAYPHLHPSDAHFGASRVLHFIVTLSRDFLEEDMRAASARAEAMYGAIVRREQLEARSAEMLIQGSFERRLQPTAPPEHPKQIGARIADASAVPWYLRADGHPPQV